MPILNDVPSAADEPDGAPKPPSGAAPIDNPRQREEHSVMEARLAKIESVQEQTVRALDLLQRRLDDGLRELHAEIREARRDARADTDKLCLALRAEIDKVRSEARQDNEKTRDELASALKWLVGLHLATLLAVLGGLARLGHLL